VIAVSEAMRRDVAECYPGVDPDRLHVIPNGIDTSRYAPDGNTDVLRRLGIDPDRPSVAFVGRITRQKGVGHLLRAARDFAPEAQLVLLAGAADTPELAKESEAAVDHLRATRSGVVWVEDMLPRHEVVQVLSHATVFCCPSIYEPQGIVNLEAMACGTAVVASAVGGIPEVVVHGRTGLLVPYAENDPDCFEREFAEAVNALVADPDRARAMGAAGRARAVRDYDWGAIARRTRDVYTSVLDAH
jgi:starch synthase